MGIALQARMRYACAALALALLAASVVAINTNEDVIELVDAGVSKVEGAKLAALNAAAAHDIVHPGDGTQTGRSGALPTRAAPKGQAPLPNFPGTPYGKPGYKESHNWETDIDYFTPLIFNWKIYASMYGLADKTEEQVKKDWMDVGLKADAKYPDCRQGVLTFSPNKYYRANPDIADQTKGLCKGIVENFLKEGLFEGLKTEDSTAENRYLQRLAKDKLMAMKGNVVTKQFYNPSRRRRRRNASTWSLRRNQQQPYKAFASRQEYTLTWWQKGSTIGGWGSVLHYGNSNGERSPGIWMYPRRTRLHFRVAQSNSGNWGCDPGQAINSNTQHWYMVALVVSKKDDKCTGDSCAGRATVYYDGKKVHQCDSTGYTLIRPNRRFYTSDPWYSAARQQMKDLYHYPGTPLTAELISTEHDVVRSASNLK